jgi:hypothetical protein
MTDMESLEDIDNYLANPVYWAEKLCDKNFRQSIINFVTSNSQWGQSRLQSRLLDLRKQSQEETMAALQGVQNQKIAADVLSLLAESAIPVIVSALKTGDPLEASAGRRAAHEGADQKDVEGIIVLLDLMSCSLLPEDSNAVWKKLLEGIVGSQSACRFLTTHWDILKWLLKQWDAVFSTSPEIDNALRPLIVVPWSRLGEFLQLRLYERHAEWNIFAVEKLISNFPLTSHIAEDLEQHYREEIDDLLAQLLQEQRLWPLAADFATRLITNGYTFTADSLDQPEATKFLVFLNRMYQSLSLSTTLEERFHYWREINTFIDSPTATPETLKALATALSGLSLPSDRAFIVKLSRAFAFCVKDTTDLTTILEHVEPIPKIDKIQLLYSIAEQSAELYREHEAALVPCLAFALSSKQEAQEHFVLVFLDTLLHNINVLELERWKKLNTLVLQEGLSSSALHQWRDYLNGLQLLDKLTPHLETRNGLVTPQAPRITVSRAATVAYRTAPSRFLKQSLPPRSLKQPMVRLVRRGTVGSSFLNTTIMTSALTCISVVVVAVVLLNNLLNVHPQLTAPRLHPQPSSSQLALPVPTPYPENWSGVQLAQPFDNELSTAEILQEGGHFSWLTEGHPDLTKLAAWRRANKAIQVGIYLPFSRDWYNDTHPMEPLSWWQATHPDWIVYQCDRRTPAYILGEPNVPLDFTNPAVVQWQVQTFLLPASRDGYDFVAADNVDLTNWGGACGVFHNGVWQNLFTKETPWKMAVVNWLRELKQRLPKGMQVIPNVSFSDVSPNPNPSNPDNELINNLISITDGIVEEDGFTILRERGESMSWNDHLSFINQVQMQGKPYFSINQVADVSKLQHADFSTLDWILSSYLLMNHGHEYLTIAGYQQYGTILLLPQYQEVAQLGHPTADPQENGVFFWRLFQHGIALVNPSHSPWKPNLQFLLPQQFQQCRELSGEHYSRNDDLSLLPFSGKILFCN